MKDIFKQIPPFINYLFLFGVVIFISFLFPSNLKFKYDFKKGDLWRYEDLIAPFDFPVLKNAEEVAKEKEKLKEEYPVYFEWDTEIPGKQIRFFESAFQEKLKSLQNNAQFEDVFVRANDYKVFGKKLLESFYKRGIIALPNEFKDKGNDFVVTILKGNQSIQYTLGSLLTIDKIKDLLPDSLLSSRLRESDLLYSLLESAIRPNIRYKKELTEQNKNASIANLSKTRGMVHQGDLIVPKGAIITEETYMKLASFKAKYEEEVSSKKVKYTVWGGYFLLTGLIILVFFVYLRHYTPEVYSSMKRMSFIFLWPILFSYLVFLVEKTDVLSAYMIPFCIVPIVVKHFFNVRLALLTHIVVVFIASFLSSLGYEFTLMQILAGLVILISDVDSRDWSKIFRSIGYLFLTYAISSLGLSIIQEGSLSAVNWGHFGWLFFNVFLTLMAYPLIPLIERLFGFTSSFTLMELADMNQPLLKELALKAPGTLQHSLQVANLAEGAALKIGANALLLKVAAYYHDIGKTKNPQYFIENQSGENPHQTLDVMDSAKVIIRHVPDGAAMARKGKLPQLLIDFILTHHGTTRVEYFYRTYKNEHPDEEVDESLFRYPGPKPSTKEQAILMLADSIEAASKSLKNPSEEELFSFIDKIVEGKINQGQLDDANLTFRELNECVDVFKAILKSVYHVRVEYPEEKGKKR